METVNQPSFRIAWLLSPPFATPIKIGSYLATRRLREDYYRRPEQQKEITSTQQGGRL